MEYVNKHKSSCTFLPRAECEHDDLGLHILVHCNGATSMRVYHRGEKRSVESKRLETRFTVPIQTIVDLTLVYSPLIDRCVLHRK